MYPISENDRLTFKAVTAASLEGAGGVSNAARLLNVASSTLTKYASTGEEWRESFIRLDLAVALDRHTDHPFFLNAMSQMVADKPQPSFGSVTAAAMLRLDGILEDVVRVVAMALEDNVFDAAEKLAARKRIVAAQQGLARLDAAIVGAG